MKQESSYGIIIIDVFRAFTTAAAVLTASPSRYLITNQCSVISKLVQIFPEALLIGKPEVNSDQVYHIPNSPTRVNEVDLNNKTILHRTEAGAKGILDALNEGGSHVFAVGFVNAIATVKYLKKFNISNISIRPMGHEARAPSLEDDICSEYLDKLIRGKPFYLEKYVSDIQQQSGKYFFTDDQWQYPENDFNLCLTLNKFDFAIRAFSEGDHASLLRCHIPHVA